MRLCGLGRKNLQLVILLVLQGMLDLGRRNVAPGPNKMILIMEIDNLCW